MMFGIDCFRKRNGLLFGHKPQSKAKGTVERCFVTRAVFKMRFYFTLIWYCVS